VHVPFTNAGAGYTEQLGITLQRRNVAAPGVSHPRAQATHQLVDHRGHAAFVGDTALDTLGHQLVGRFLAVQIEFVLKVTVAAAAAHRAERAHPAVFLEAAALIQDDLTRAFISTGKQAAHHHGAGAHGDCLGDVA
jgi:hypothetical protein